MCAWIRLDDQIFLHPKIVAAGKDATLLYLSGIAYASSQLTDGFVPVAALRVIAATVNVNPKGASRLAELGLWEQVDGGYLIHDYLEYNPSANKVRAERDAAKARMQRSRSQNVRANNGRSSGEVRESPSPSPSPVKTSQELKTIPEGEGDEEVGSHAHARNGVANGVSIPADLSPGEEERAQMLALKIPQDWYGTKWWSLMEHYEGKPTERRTPDEWRRTCRRLISEDWAKVLGQQQTRSR